MAFHRVLWDNGKFSIRDIGARSKHTAEFCRENENLMCHYRESVAACCYFRDGWNSLWISSCSVRSLRLFSNWLVFMNIKLLKYFTAFQLLVWTLKNIWILIVLSVQFPLTGLQSNSTVEAGEWTRPCISSRFASIDRDGSWLVPCTAFGTIGTAVSSLARKSQTSSSRWTYTWPHNVQAYHYARRNWFVREISNPVSVNSSDFRCMFSFLRFKRCSWWWWCIQTKGTLVSFI